MQPAIIYEDEDIIVCKKPAGVATQTRRIGQADMESLLKITVHQRGASLYWCGTSVRPAGGRHYGVCKNKEAAAGSKPPDQNKTGGQILLCDDGRRAGKEKKEP